jgi:hypothetical protein
MQEKGMIEIRDDLATAQARAWAVIGHPGTWWSGAERVAIAAETRAAAGCALCAARRTALAPAAVPGTHQRTGSLPRAAVEAIHRIRTDSGRLGEGWYRRLLAEPEGGLTDAHYIELLAIAALVVARDSFAAAVGLPPAPFPPVQPGEPSRRRPRGARSGLAWMATLAPEDRAPEDPDLYCEYPGPRRRGGGYVHLALSLVPRSMIHWWDLFETMYLPAAAMRDFGREYRAITHAQMEMLAARVAALNQCVY